MKSRQSNLQFDFSFRSILELIQVPAIHVLVVVSVLVFNAELLCAGNEAGYGGDSYGEEFVSLADEIIKELSNPQYSTLLKENRVSLSELRGRLNVIARSDEGEDVKLLTQINGRVEEEEVDAINFPESNRVKLNRTRWRGKSLYAKLKLTLHEFFGLLSIERDHWAVSMRFKEVLSDLSRRLLNQASGPVRYHGRVAVGPPMNVMGDVCSETQPHVIEAVTQAKVQAIGFCQTEQNRVCSIKLTEIEAVWDKKTPGYIYCEVRTVAR
jgi:hypothetical protein